MSAGLAAALLVPVLAWPQQDAAGKSAVRHEFQGPEACAVCHPRHFQEWRGSPHAYSAINPIVQACNRKALSETGGAIGALCVNCHAPLAARAGELFGDLDMSKLSPMGRHGVSCEICHRMEPPADGQPIANASFRLAEGNVVFGRLANPTATPAHDAVHSEFIRSSKFCGSCHDVLHNSALLEKTFAQWQGSIHDKRSDQCQSCHMLQYSGQAAVGGPFREKLHRHNFPAVSIPLVPFPNRGQQREQIQEFLRTAARMEALAPGYAAAGGELAFTVSVKNAGAGHNLPTGLSNERQMWIEATVTDAGGRVLYQSGGLDANGDLMDHHSALRPGADPDLVLFADRFLNDQGKEVPFLWLASRVEEQSLKPLEERGARYQVAVPQDMGGGKLRIRVRLLFRPFPPYALRDLGLGELVKELPVWIMDDWRSEWIPVGTTPRRAVEWRVPQDFAGLTEALRELRDGDRLLVAPGEHVIDRPLDFGGRSITVESIDGSSRTTIRLREARDNGSVVVFQSGEAPAARLQGFRLTGGRGKLIDGVRRGGAVYMSRASPTLVDLQIDDCKADGGLGGGVYCEHASPAVHRLQVRDAVARVGGGLYISGAGSRVRLDEVRVNGASAESGAGIFLGAGVDATMVRVELAGNRASAQGGGLLAEAGSTWSLDRATIVYNRAGGPGPAAIRAPGEMETAVTHAIVVANVPPGIDARLSYAIVDFDPPSATCSKELPLFMDPTGRWEAATGRWLPGEYRLLFGSKAIDAGDPDAPPDADDSVADLGAHYFEQRPRAFLRGDVDADGMLTARDVGSLFAALQGVAEIPCRDAADLNDDGIVLPVDLAWLASHVIAAAPPPAPPWPDCGLDPSLGDGLTCSRTGKSCRDD